MVLTKLYSDHEYGQNTPFAPFAGKMVSEKYCPVGHAC